MIIEIARTAIEDIEVKQLIIDKLKQENVL